MDQIKYLTACPDLSKDAPVGHPHLVDVSTVNMDFPRPEPGLGIADMVVTVLFNHSPETLQRFLDLSHNFKYWIRHKAERGSLDFCIIRDGLTVTCGHLTESKMRQVQLWDDEHVYRMDNGPTGKWTPVLWQGWPGLQETTKNKILEQGGYVVKNLLTSRIWEGYDGVDIVVEDSCDI